MKKMLTLALVLMLFNTVAAQQGNPETKKKTTANDGSIEPAKTSIISTGSKQAGPKPETEKPDAVNNANGSYTGSKDPADASRYPNNSGSAVSPSSPNYPYAPDGTIIISPGEKGKGAKKAVSNTKTSAAAKPK